MTPGSDQLVSEMSTRNLLGLKGGRRVRLATSPPSASLLSTSHDRMDLQSLLQGLLYLTLLSVEEMCMAFMSWRLWEVYGNTYYYYYYYYYYYSHLQSESEHQARNDGCLPASLVYSSLLIYCLFINRLSTRYLHSHLAYERNWEWSF
jgi:hypothetical protein